MFKAKPNPWLISRLLEVQRLKNRSTKVDFKALKRAFAILVVDDKEVPFLEPLRANGYNIRHISDVEDVSAAAEYDMVLCDIWGVGAKLNSKIQGAHLAGAIKKNYPEKFVYAFTAEKTDAIISDTLRKANINGILAKDADIDEWIDSIDDCLRQAADPYQLWLRTRSGFVSKEVSARVVAVMEHNFVLACEKSDISYFYNQKIDYGLSEDVKRAVEKFAVSSTVKLLMAGIKGA